MFSSLCQCTALMEVGSERRGRIDCREMCQGCMPCTCRMLRTSIHQPHPAAAPSLASKDSRRGSVADSAGGRAPRKSVMRQPRDSGAFLYSFPAALRLPTTDIPGFSFCSWAGCTRHEMHVDARHAQLHVDSEVTSERLQARRPPHDHQSRALCYLAAGNNSLRTSSCRGTQHGQDEPGCSGDQRRQRGDIQGRCAQVRQVFLRSAAQRQSRRLNCELPGEATPWAD